MMQMQGIEALEMQYTTDASLFWEGLMDLNVPNDIIAMNWQQLFSERGRLLVAYGLPQGKMMGGLQRPQGAAGAVMQTGEPNWKSSFRETFAKKIRQLEKDEITYATQEAEGGYVATLSLAKEGKQFVGEACKSKKDAEQSATKTAMMEMFPQEAQNSNTLKRLNEGQPVVEQPPAKKAKKGGAPEEPKGRFTWAMTLILGQATTKDQVVYETEQVGDGSYQSTLSAPDLTQFLGEEKIFTGEPADSKKGAEANAAEVAWRDIEPHMKDIIADHEAKRKEKNAESLAKLKKSHEEKKAAAAAAATGAATGEVASAS